VRWTRKSIIAEIKRLHEANEELYYSKAEENHLNLVRAAGWHYGTWRRAVEAAGIDYESLSRYQRWSKQRIIDRIRDLHEQGHELHWRAVSTQLDPALAAAALRPNGFSSWREALAAAGFDIDEVARYKEWDEEKVLKAIRKRKRAGLSMHSKSLQTEDQSLFCAARRRFGSWDGALNAAGMKAEKIRLRKFNPALNAPRKKKNATDSPSSVKASAVKRTAKNGTSPNGKATGKVQISVKAPAQKAAKATTKTPAKKASKARR
jgi:hypothetical protein